MYTFKKYGNLGQKVEAIQANQAGTVDYRNPAGHKSRSYSEKAESSNKPTATVARPTTSCCVSLVAFDV